MPKATFQDCGDPKAVEGQPNPGSPEVSVDTTAGPGSAGMVATALGRVVGAADGGVGGGTAGSAGTDMADAGALGTAVTCSTRPGSEAGGAPEPAETISAATAPAAATT